MQTKPTPPEGVGVNNVFKVNFSIKKYSKLIMCLYTIHNIKN